MVEKLPDTFDIHAAEIARRIVLRKVPAETVLAAAPMIFSHGTGYVSLFRYGVAVFINVPADEQRKLIDETLREYLEDPRASGEVEQLRVIIAPNQDERLVGERIYLRDGSLARVQVLAEVMARSVLLAGYESRISKSFDLVEPLADRLAQSRGPRTGSELLKTIGSALVTEHHMVGRATVSEKPELLWEHAELEGYYLLLENEFELKERDSALVRKINLISRTAQTALELLQARRSLRVEWYIVFLIIVEICLSLIDLAVRYH